MGFEITSRLSVGAINPNIHINRKRYNTSFGQTLNADKFERQSIDKYTTETAIRRMIEANPKIKNIVKDFNPEMQLNLEELKELLQNHASDTQNVASGIINNLPFSLKYKVDEKSIDDAAYLHDIGKILIPKEILNKSGKLDDRETKIMHCHSELGYEMLKTTDINPTTLKLIRNHHQNQKRTGYPWVGNDFNADLNLQILSVSDKYSALTENRVYKKALSPKEALTIIYQDVKEGKIHPLVFKALINYVDNMSLAKVSQA